MLTQYVSLGNCGGFVTLHPVLTIIIPPRNIPLHSKLTIKSSSINDRLVINNFCGNVHPKDHKNSLNELLTKHKGTRILLSTISPLVISEIKDCFVYDYKYIKWLLLNHVSEGDTTRSNVFYGKSIKNIYLNLFDVESTNQ
jgi:hypothetical protein